METIGGDSGIEHRTRDAGDMTVNEQLDRVAAPEVERMDSKPSNSGGGRNED